MSYKQAMAAARTCTNYDEVDALLRRIEDDDNISDGQYYNIRRAGNVTVARLQLSAE